MRFYSLTNDTTPGYLYFGYVNCADINRLQLGKAPDGRAGLKIVVTIGSTRMAFAAPPKPFSNEIMKQINFSCITVLGLE